MPRRSSALPKIIAILLLALVVWRAIELKGLMGSHTALLNLESRSQQPTLEGLDELETRILSDRQRERLRELRAELVGELVGQELFILFGDNDFLFSNFLIKELLDDHSFKGPCSYLIFQSFHKGRWYL